MGGHVMEGKIFTTLELVVGSLPEVKFTREIDVQTGFDELVVRPADSSDTTEDNNKRPRKEENE